MTNDIDQLKRLKKDYVYMLISAVLFPVVGFMIYFLFGELENGGLSTMSVPTFVYVLYQLLGRLGTLCAFIIIGLACFIYGKISYSSKKKKLYNNLNNKIN